VIANHFAEFFEGLYNSEDSSHDDQKSECNDMLKQYIGDPFKCSFSESDIARVIWNLKAGKAAGADGLVAEHFKYCHSFILVLLSILFQAVIRAGEVPTSFKTSILVPIPKNDLDKRHVENYRGIALCTTSSKIFEMAIQSCLNDYLVTSNPICF
jgi:hypothetical protein